MATERAREILHRAYMQGYREGRLSVLSERRQTPRRTTLAGLLLTHLESGPRPAEEVLAIAKQQGISTNTLRAAKTELRIQSVKRRDCWLWVLPEHLGTLQDTKAQDQLAFPVETGIHDQDHTCAVTA